MAKPYSHENTMRAHDVAFYNFWSGLRVDYGRQGLGLMEQEHARWSPPDRSNLPILMVRAAPSRVVAETVDLLTNTGWIAGNDTAVQEQNAAYLRDRAKEDFAILPLPLVSWQRTTALPRLEDAGPSKVFTKQCFGEEEGEFRQHRFPYAFDIQYIATVWSKREMSADFIREYLMSRMGTSLGLSNNETLIPVTHREPFGVLNQALKIEGDSDQSELEGGENMKSLRHAYEFTLKAWHYYGVPGLSDQGLAEGVTPGDTFQGATKPAVSYFDLAECVMGPVPDTYVAEDQPLTVSAAQLSLNMFSFFIADNQIATKWPKLGTGATVRRGTITPTGEKPANTLRIGVTAQEDEVLISNRTIGLDADGVGVMTLSFLYTADADTELLISTRIPNNDPAVTPTWFTNRKITLPARANWTRVQLFALMRQSVYSVTLRGTGTPAIAYLSGINLRQVSTAGILSATNVVTIPTETAHSFSNAVIGENYLVVVNFDAAAVSGLIDVEGVTYPVNATEESEGFVLPDTVNGPGLYTVRTPTAVPVQWVRLLPYAGFWDGIEI